MPSLASLTTIGIVLFGSSWAPNCARRAVRAQFKAACWVGLSSTVLPIALGIAIVPVLHPVLAPHGLVFWPFALLLGVALSITAFPGLARILKDRNMARTRNGPLPSVPPA